MPLNNDELIRAAEMVAECKEMKITLKCSLLGACVTSVTTFAGGLIAGPIGLAAGAGVGGLIAYNATKDKFKPVLQVLREDLSISQKERLAYHIQEAIKDVDAMDAVALFLLITRNEAPVMLIYKAMKHFLEKDMKYSLM